MISRKDVLRFLEKFDPSDKQANAIYMRVKHMSLEDFRDITATANDIQDVFDAISSSDSSDNYSYIDLRKFSNIPSNAQSQFCNDPIGFWLRLETGEWVFVKEDRLSTFNANWNHKGEIIRPEYKPVSKEVADAEPF